MRRGSLHSTFELVDGQILHHIFPLYTLSDILLGSFLLLPSNLLVVLLFCDSFQFSPHS